MKELKGIYPIIPTAYTARGNVDYDGVKNVLRTRAAVGTDGFTLFGIAGEYYKQSDEEARRLAEAVAGECHALGKPVVMSVTQHSTLVACEQAKYLESLGADCVMVLPPFFMKPGGDSIHGHTKAIAKSVKTSVMVQYAPEQTGVSIAPDVWKRLSEECENVAYYKIECKPSGGYISKMLDIMAPKPGIFAGNCGFQMIENFDRGAVGCMPCAAIVEMYIKIYRAYQAGDREEAVRVHNAMLPLYNHIRQNVEMSIHYEKKIMKLRGIIESDHCRMPSITPDKYLDKLFDMYYDAVKPYLA